MMDQKSAYVLFKNYTIELPQEATIEISYHDWVKREAKHGRLALDAEGRPAQFAPGEPMAWRRTSRYEDVELLDITPDYVLYRDEDSHVVYRPMRTVEQIFLEEVSPRLVNDGSSAGDS